MNVELQQLFSSGSPGDVEVRPLGVLKRHGHPLLYLPRKHGLALQALDLYPAQRPLAKFTRNLWRLVCAAGLAPALPCFRLTLESSAPLNRFLATLSSGARIPEFAILAGNPESNGRRFILLVFSQDGRRAFVVKAGGDQAAFALIEQEARILEAIRSNAAGVPRLRAVHRTESVHALALDYVEGSSPKTTDNPRMADVLGSWIDEDRHLQAVEVPAWQRLVQACSEHPVLRKVRDHLEKVSFHPVLYHGDFAPWNVRVAGNGSWQVLDWERGELTGLPCWDWFHYQVQVGLLVKRFPPKAHARHINQWLGETSLQQYTNHAGVTAIIRELFLAYLLYSMEIIGPSQSLPAKRDLLNTLVAQWKSV